MAYVIMRTEKYKTRDKIAGLVGHHLRTPGSKLDNVDLSRSHLNVVIGAHDRDSFNKAVRDRLATCTRKPRPDANKVVEMLLGASPEFFAGKSYDEQKAYLYDCLDYAKGVFGEANIVGAYMHFDEKTPHLSILAVPIETSMRKTKKLEREVTTLNASHFFAGQEAMIQMQTDVALFVQGRGHDLLRGEPKAETRREHEPLGKYWKNKALEAEQAGIAAADLLNDACLKSRVASDLLAVALDEAQRTGVEFEAMTVQRAALDAERVALQELRAAVVSQGRGLDQEWAKLRKKTTALAERDIDLSHRVESLKRERATLDERRESVRHHSGLVARRQAEFEQFEYAVASVQACAQRPELLGMLDFLAENKEARDFLGLLKADPAMAQMVKQTVEVAIGLGAEPQAAAWPSEFAQNLDLQSAIRGLEPLPLPTGFDWSSGGPAGP